MMKLVSHETTLIKWDLKRWEGQSW